jgi:hypothetical protein
LGLNYRTMPNARTWARPKPRHGPHTPGSSPAPTTTWGGLVRSLEKFRV